MPDTLTAMFNFERHFDLPARAARTQAQLASLKQRWRTAIARYEALQEHLNLVEARLLRAQRRLTAVMEKQWPPGVTAPKVSDRGHGPSARADQVQHSVKAISG